MENHRNDSEDCIIFYCNIASNFYLCSEVDGTGISNHSVNDCTYQVAGDTVIILSDGYKH